MTYPDPQLDHAWAHVGALRILLALLRDDDAAEDDLFGAAFDLDRAGLAASAALVLAGVLAEKIRKSEHRDAWERYYRTRLMRVLDSINPDYLSRSHQSSEGSPIFSGASSVPRRKLQSRWACRQLFTSAISSGASFTVFA